MRARRSTSPRRGRLWAGACAVLTGLEVAALSLVFPAGAGARGVAHEADGGSAPGLSPAAIARAEPQPIPQLPPDDGTSADPPPGSDASGSVRALPPPTADSSRKLPREPFASRAVAEPTSLPNSANGRLFGRINGKGAYSCSASVVRTPNRSVIFTAGHCVKEPGRGGWARQLTFIPSYTDGAGPFGLWEWRSIHTSKQWARRGNPNFDYAAVVLRRNEGQRIADVTGALGFAYGVRRNRTYRAVGYPVNKDHGERMWECISRYGGPDPFPYGPGPVPIGIGCDMLNGSSGGGWTISRNRLASLSSFYVLGFPDELFGPRLTRRANRIRREAGGKARQRASTRRGR